VAHLYGGGCYLTDSLRVVPAAEATPDDHDKNGILVYGKKPKQGAINDVYPFSKEPPKWSQYD